MASTILIAESDTRRAADVDSLRMSSPVSVSNKFSAATDEDDDSAEHSERKRPLDGDSDLSDRKKSHFTGGIYNI